MKNTFTVKHLLTCGVAILASLLLVQCQSSSATEREKEELSSSIPKDSTITHDTLIAGLDTSLYDQMIRNLFHLGDSLTSPVRTVYPLAGALLPFSRIVAFYGNLYSTRMGILGAIPPEEMLDSLKQEVKRWEMADSTRDVQPALHYIAVTAQRDPGKGGKYRLRMPFKEIDKVLEIASRIDAIVFLDIQTGRSTLQEEIPQLREYLLMPNVHLGVDPEYSMKGAYVPGKKVGTMDASEINYASDYLAALVKEYNIPPKILVVHRFKKTMVTNYRDITLRPEVQIVVHMDGFGSRGKKKTTYANTITKEPVQFTGFKLFYKNDIADPAWINIMQPEEILKLNPVPVYIQYQ